MATEYVGDVTIPTQVIKYKQFFFRRFNQSDCHIHITLNYMELLLVFQQFFSYIVNTRLIRGRKPGPVVMKPLIKGKCLDAIALVVTIRTQINISRVRRLVLL
jgi:hypothetical protein